MADELMTMPEQQALIMQLRAIATVVNGLDPKQLQRFIDARNRASTIGPLFQPTSWLQKGAFDSERAWIALAGGAITFRRVVSETAEALERAGS